MAGYDPTLSFALLALVTLGPSILPTAAVLVIGLSIIKRMPPRQAERQIERKGLPRK